MYRYPSLVLIALALLCSTGLASGADAKLNVVATFSVIADMVHTVGGDRIALSTLVKRNGDAHVYRPSVGDVRAIANAELIFINGAGFEGWIERLLESTAYPGPVITLTAGIALQAPGAAHAETRGAHHNDPHAWQDLSRGAQYIDNILAALNRSDPANSAYYTRRAQAYRQQILALDQSIKTELSSVSAQARTVVTTHNAFGYFGTAYGIRFLSPTGLSTEAESSAARLAALIRLIKTQQAVAFFLENISDPRLLQQIGAETGARIGGTLYSDALSAHDGPAPTYLAMMRHNADELLKALTAGSG